VHNPFRLEIVSCIRPSEMAFKWFSMDSNLMQVCVVGVLGLVLRFAFG